MFGGGGDVDLMQRRRELLGMQSELPSAYRRVEYLESSGTQAIYTDIQGRNNITCHAKVMWISGGATDASIFGARQPVSNRVLLIHQYPSNRWTLGNGSSYAELGIFDYGTVYQVDAKVTPGEQYLIIDGTAIYTGTDPAEYVNTFNMSLFACTYGNANNFRLGSSARIYELMASVNGQNVANYIPCVRKSDSKPGMYDTVTKTFYTNAGTGEFIVPA